MGPYPRTLVNSRRCFRLLNCILEFWKLWTRIRFVYLVLRVGLATFTSKIHAGTEDRLDFRSTMGFVISPRYVKPCVFYGVQGATC